MACALLAVAATASASRLRIRSDFGPENTERPLRSATRYIVLHTTEGREPGSLRKLRTHGEAHYFVRRDGRVLRLIDRRRIAMHAGLSMWNGRTHLDEVSLGIEVSGYHDKRPTPAQYAALRELLRQLQSLYDIPDDHVLTHSMVAYGAPNRFHPHRHRGRKRCAMIFANPEVRRRLGLTDAPRQDPDVAAGRLRVGDRQLQHILYPAPTRRAHVRSSRPSELRRDAARPGDDTIAPERTAWSIAGRAYASRSTLYVFPDGRRVHGDELRDWGAIPIGTRVLVSQERSSQKSAEATARPPVNGLLLVSQPTAARELLGSAATAETTTYLFPSGSVHNGADLDGKRARQLEQLPAGTRVLVGYVNAGRVARGESLTQLAGSRWNQPSTYYRVPTGRIRTGAEIDDDHVPAGTLVFLRQ